MLSIFYCHSEHHVSTTDHPERAIRVDLAVKYLKNKLNSSLFVENNLSDRQKCIDMMINIHGESILETFEMNSDDVFVCQSCKKEQFGEDTCQHCGHKYFTWYFEPDTFVSNTTKDDVIKCMSTIMNAIDTIKSGYKYSYLLTRPPNHHCFNKGNGFCIINNVIVGARYAQSLGYKRVYILDWDYHAGNGTAKLLNDDTFLCSIHAFGPFVYPGTGSIEENTSNCMNIPLPIKIHSEKSMRQYDDEFYMKLIDFCVMPSIIDFKTDLIIISNGFDAHKDDPVGGLGLTNKFFSDATKSLKQMDIPMVYVLEGGYNPEVIRNASSDIIDELLR